ncbi:hypothetical protein ACO22_05236 [Paracoccidioides brasiliensis]|uniref:PH domain-containing protein n=1 Tax=Paracoccidioides brasiliensis TaxID=121759 RepID=A0A1D2JAW0_PARBR|nr:hypothetical protein ACO22_05236 [Paracoccidioides brasiliensis]
MLPIFRFQLWKVAKTAANRANSKDDGSSTSPTPTAFFSRQRHNAHPLPIDKVPSNTFVNAQSNTLKQKMDQPLPRPASAAYLQSPLMDVAPETVPELEPVFNYLSGQANKLYQEGYLLKLNDLDINGRSFQDRQWVDCFAQLIGTVLSLWDSAALDAAGPEGDASPTFINLADASIKMIESLPTRNEGSKSLQNILSVSTAGKNRYLLHFSSVHSLTQWTAAIRISMFENTLLQESYTGALIAGKGKALVGIRGILEKTWFVYEDWARVRFGPGTPWKRCWCVISPPDEKEFQRMKKEQRKKSVYDRTIPLLKGNIKFYETKKTKRVKPIATITDAYSAFAIYPQSRPLIDQSTLVKVEGRITIHSKPESTADGFIFVLPEIHPGVSGFEMMLRWLFPVYDTFGLYGRPARLIADTQNTRSLMFALPKHQQSGYLDILDVTALIHTEGSNNWSEREWRKAMKEATARRMATSSNSRESSVAGSKRYNRSSLPSGTGTSLRFASGISNPPTGKAEFNHSSDAVNSMISKPGHGAAGTMSDRSQATPPSISSLEKSLPEEDEYAPQPPAHQTSQNNGVYGTNGQEQRNSSTSDIQEHQTLEHQAIASGYQQNPPPAPVSMPPAFLHDPRSLPPVKPQPSPDIQKAGSRVSQGTLFQMVDINMAKNMATAGAAAAWDDKNSAPQSKDQGQNGVVVNHGDHEQSSTNMNFSSQSPIISPDNTARLHYSQIAQTPRIKDPTPSQDFSRPNSFDKRSSRASSLSLDTHKVTTRKLVAARQTYEIPYSSKASSLESFRNTIDAEALDRVVARRRSPSPPTDIISNDEESVYDQNSVSSPDYASSHRSSTSQRSEKSIPKPRMGVLKVIGKDDSEVAIGDVRYYHADALASQKNNPDIPLVDFGPTQAYVPTSRRPTSADTLALLTHKRIPSDNVVSRDRDERRPSPGNGKTSHSGTSSDSHLPNTTSTDDHRRTAIWQPGMVRERASAGACITPKQFVKQKLEANRGGLHVRVSSGSSQPPRPASGDWTNYHRKQSTMIQDMPVRPHSRGASVMLGASGPGVSPPARPASGDWANTTRQQLMMTRDAPRPHSRGANAVLGSKDISSHLSAREQEHLARMTGSSFFNFSSQNQSAAPVHGTSLVSAIDAREREKKAIKEGVRGHTVQQAIAQRQYHQAQAQFRTPSPAIPSQYGTASYFPPQMYHQHASSGSSVSSYGYGYPQQQQQQQLPGSWPLDQYPQQQQQQHQQHQHQHQHQRQQSWSSAQQLFSFTQQQHPQHPPTPQHRQQPTRTPPPGCHPNLYYQPPPQPSPHNVGFGTQNH